MVVGRDLEDATAEKQCMEVVQAHSRFTLFGIFKVQPQIWIEHDLSTGQLSKVRLVKVTVQLREITSPSRTRVSRSGVRLELPD